MTNPEHYRNEEEESTLDVSVWFDTTNLGSRLSNSDSDEIFLQMAAGDVGNAAEILNEKYQWVGARFNQEPEMLQRHPTLARDLLTIAIQDKVLEEWEVEAIHQGEVPELPSAREARLAQEKLM